MKSLAIDLFCGLGGWAEGFLAEGYDVIGFDIERHDYGTGGYPGQLVLQDVLTLDGSQFKDAAVIVASPPCQAYSYRAMPWKRAKALPPPDNSLFEACFRIQKEAGRVPLIVENVRGAEKWIGPAAWHFGSYYLWGDVPALMPISLRLRKSSHVPLTETPPGTGKTSWFFGNSKHEARNYGVKIEQYLNIRDGHSHTRHLTNPEEHDLAGRKGFTKRLGENSLGRMAWSTSVKRKMASAMIAKIPFPLAQHIARVFKP